ncbi:unnamed protein product [Mytilus coruscus]|uniref:Uncharacterized protein n=1 Tax=Mytilus coruscus TaxID=42192 RepID=A0A6J8C0B7_MYTCO|nr:unnamed protein product [Mytilus coruscus]
MAEEYIIVDPVVENCNVFQDQTTVVKDDGSLHLIHTGAPSSSQSIRLTSVRKRATVEKNKKGAELNNVPFTSVEVNQQRPDFVSEEESERGYESSQENEEEMTEEPREKRMKVSMKMSKMKKVENILSKKQKLGSPVHDQIAKIVNQGAEPDVDHKNKEVPKVNKVLWNSKETSKHLKDADRSLQRTQGYLVKGMIPVVQLMERSLKNSSEESEETFELSLDSLNLLLYAHRDSSSQRRKLLTPALDKTYLALGHKEEKISPNYLFGDRENLEQRMKEIDDSTKLGNK